VSDEILIKAEERMEKALLAFRRDLSSVRAGRATPSLLDKVTVEYYGSAMPINQLANISIPESRMIVIQPWDKSSFADIEKAILKSDLGLTPTNDGSVIRIVIPQLTEQRRQDLVKVIRKIAEEGRVAVRNIRRESNDEMKKAEKSGDVSEDESHRAHEKIQELTDRFIAEIDKTLASKERDLLEV